MPDFCLKGGKVLRSIEIPYGRGRQIFHIEDHRLTGVLMPETMPKAGEETEIVRRAISEPIDSARLSTLSQTAERILLITSDHTRPVPSRITLPLLLEEIREGNPKAEITILIATGLHRATTRQEMEQKFGKKLVDEEHFVVHDARADDQMADFGMLPSGGRLRLNAIVREADLIVAEEFIEPHFFAGFSGGRKSILPGIASMETICYNHNAKFIHDKKARQGSLSNNPIHLDMIFAARQAGLRFILNVVLDHNKRIVGAFCGEPEAAHETGCRYCEKLTGVEAVSADIVVTSNGGYPLDQNIYQTVKGLTAGESCVRQGGVLILCAALEDGHGGEAFYRWFSERESPEEVLREIESTPPEQTTADQWQAQILARVMLKAQIIYVCEEKDRATVEAMHMKWAANVDDALRMAEEMLGGEPSVTVIPDGVGVIVKER